MLEFKSYLKGGYEIHLENLIDVAPQVSQEMQYIIPIETIRYLYKGIDVRLILKDMYCELSLFSTNKNSYKLNLNYRQNETRKIGKGFFETCKI